jgi:hypothetical protein
VDRLIDGSSWGDSYGVEDGMNVWFMQRDLLGEVTAAVFGLKTWLAGSTQEGGLWSALWRKCAQHGHGAYAAWEAGVKAITSIRGLSSCPPISVITVDDCDIDTRLVGPPNHTTLLRYRDQPLILCVLQSYSRL